MRVALIAAGAGGMYCGSCLRDITLSRALRAAGVDVTLIPLYTPLKTEDDDGIVTTGVFYGGINVYLQQHAALFRHTPRWLDGLLDFKPLLRRATRNAGAADPAGLVDLTLSVLEGAHGHQKKELARLVQYLRDDVRPDVVNLPNALLLGPAEPIRRETGAAVLCTLTGEDVFIDAMPPDAQRQVKALIARQAAHVDAFIATSRYYADYFAAYCGLPRERIRVVPSGIDLNGHRPAPRRRADGGPLTIGYFGRVCPEKGLHVLVDAFIALRRRGRAAPARLVVGGYRSTRDRKYFEQLQERINRAGLSADFVFHGEVDRAKKLAILHDLDLFSVPATMREPKGIYVLEALASGAPVVQPDHGAFPEIIEATGGGVLVRPKDAQALADALETLLSDHGRRLELAARGSAAVHRDFSAARMAAATLEVYEAALAGRSAGVGPAARQAPRSP